MSKSSEGVKKWRKEAKRIILTCMGEKCQICGYDKCKSALELHHINPEEKDFSFGYIMTRCRSWALMYSELTKCILLCSNCHREIHENLVELPQEYKKFDIELADSLRSPQSLSCEKSSTRSLSLDRKLLVEYKYKQRKKLSKKKELTKIYFADKEKKTRARIKMLENSEIDFSSFGWMTRVSELFNVPVQGIAKWMQRNMKEFYEEKCFRRKSPEFKDINNVN